MPHCVDHLHALPTHGHLDLLFSHHCEKPLSYYLSNGVTGRYPRHKHSRHSSDPTLSDLMPKAPPTPPKPTHHKPHPHQAYPPNTHPTHSSSIDHSSPSSGLDFTQPHCKQGSCSHPEEMEREDMTGHRLLPASHHDPISQPQTERDLDSPGQCAPCRMGLRPAGWGGGVWSPTAAQLRSPRPPRTAAALQLDPWLKKTKQKQKPATQGGLKGRAIPGLHEDCDEAYRGLINQEASLGSCPLLWLNASRSLVTEPRLAISISRPFQDPSSLRAWEGWEFGPWAWHFGICPNKVPLLLKRLMRGSKMSPSQLRSTQNLQTCLRTVTARRVGPELPTGTTVPRDSTLGKVPLGPLQKEKKEGRRFGA